VAARRQSNKKARHFQPRLHVVSEPSHRNAELLSSELPAFQSTAMSTRTSAPVAAAKLPHTSAAVNHGDSVPEVSLTMDLDSSEDATLSEESDYESGEHSIFLSSLRYTYIYALKCSFGSLEPNTSTKREPPTKKARRSGASPHKQTAAPTNRRKKSLSLLPTMPLDVLFEVSVLSLFVPKLLVSGVMIFTGYRLVFFHRFSVNSLPRIS
jgi:hypothetical protein